VHNPAPYDVRVRWTVFNYARQPMTYVGETDDGEPWVTASLRVKHGRVRVTLDLFAYEADGTDGADQQYTVEPPEAVVKAGQPAAFKVAFKSMQPGRFCSFLRGEQMIMHDEAQPVSFKVWERLPRGYESSSDEGESDVEEDADAAAAAAAVEAAGRGGDEGAGAGEGDTEEQRAGSASVSERGQGEEREEQGDGEGDTLIGGGDTASAYRTEDLATINLDETGNDSTLTSTGRRRRVDGERTIRPQPRYTLGELAAADKDILLRGCFHPFAGAPRVPMTRLHVNLQVSQWSSALRVQLVASPHGCGNLAGRVGTMVCPVLSLEGAGRGEYVLTRNLYVGPVGRV